MTRWPYLDDVVGERDRGKRAHMIIAMRPAVRPEKASGGDVYGHINT